MCINMVLGKTQQWPSIFLILTCFEVEAVTQNHSNQKDHHKDHPLDHWNVVTFIRIITGSSSTGGSSHSSNCLPWGWLNSVYDIRFTIDPIEVSSNIPFDPPIDPIYRWISRFPHVFLWGFLLFFYVFLCVLFSNGFPMASISGSKRFPPWFSHAGRDSPEVSGPR